MADTEGIIIRPIVPVYCKACKEVIDIACAYVNDSGRYYHMTKFCLDIFEKDSAHKSKGKVDYGMG